jgi:uncharacterized protein
MGDLGLAFSRPALTVIAGIVVTALIVLNQVFSLRHFASQSRESQGILFHLATKVFPQDASEAGPFGALVLTVAFCEEVIYRGFAQYVFQSVSDSALIGVVGSALLFGAAHVYQGKRGFASTSFIGLVFSAIRSVTGSLVPAIVAHFAADLMAGYSAPSRIKRGVDTRSS